MTTIQNTMAAVAETLTKATLGIDAGTGAIDSRPKTPWTGDTTKMTGDITWPTGDATVRLADGWF